MKTISVIGHNRPEYLEITLDALMKCRSLEDYNVYVSIDGPPNEDAFKDQLSCVDTATNVFADYGFRKYMIIPQIYNHGVNHHPQRVYEYVMKRCDFNVVFEDDCVPSPDSLELADFFYNHPERDDYACLCMFANSLNHEHPLDLYEKMNFCAWGWAFTREKWETVFRPAWMCHHAGWDWSLGYAIQKQGLKTLNPSLSRVKNIGREKGVHMSPEYWDNWGKDFVSSDGSHGKDYRISMRLPADYRESHLEPWVKDPSLWR